MIMADKLTLLLSLIIYNLKFHKSGLDHDNTGFKWRSVIVGSSRIWDDVINKFIPPPRHAQGDVIRRPHNGTQHNNAVIHSFSVFYQSPPCWVAVKLDVVILSARVPQGELLLKSGFRQAIKNVESLSINTTPGGSTNPS